MAQGHVLSASSNREISQMLMQQAWHKCARSLGGKFPKEDYKFFTSEGIYDNYLELLLPARVYNTNKFEGGHDTNYGIPFNGVDVIPEYTHQTYNPKN